MEEIKTEFHSSYNEIDTISHLYERQELKYLPDPFYIEKHQPHINWSMRAILLDWMMEVACEFAMKRQTYYLAINYIDRYLTKEPCIAKT